MPKRLTQVGHLSCETFLEQRYREVREPVAGSDYQILWLLAKGKRSEQVAEVKGYSFVSANR